MDPPLDVLFCGLIRNNIYYLIICFHISMAVFQYNWIPLWSCAFYFMHLKTLFWKEVYRFHEVPKFIHGTKKCEEAQMKCELRSKDPESLSFASCIHYPCAVWHPNSPRILSKGRHTAEKCFAPYRSVRCLRIVFIDISLIIHSFIHSINA